MKKYKICQKCCKEVALNTKKCICNSTKFAPTFVKKIEKLNRQFSVQVTEPNKNLYKNKKIADKRVTLYKWWPGGKSSLHINKVEEWDSIQDIINNRLWKFLNWKSKKEIINQIKDGDNKKAVKNLVIHYPDFINQLIKGLKFNKINDEDIPAVFSAFSELVSAAKNAENGLIVAIKSLIKKLPKEGKRAVEDLEDILNQWSLKQINSVTLEVKNRIDTLDIFEKAILNDKTYEIKGDGSIHNILEKSMWIIDERYWLLYSNETLKKIINKKIEKNKKYLNKRPDFVCGSVDNKLIIVEIKRPSHKLNINDLDQLETYLTIIEDHQGGSLKNFEVYLVGRSVDKDLKKRLKYRGNQFRVKTYSDLIEDVKRRYHDFYLKLNK